MTARLDKNLLTSMAFPIVRAKTVSRGLAFAMVMLASGTALAAPNGPTFYDCVAQAQAQYQLDVSMCVVYSGAQRDLCNAQATQHYADTMTGCAVAASRSSAIRTQVTPSPKQSLDAAFTRRLR